MRIKAKYIVILCLIVALCFFCIAFVYVRTPEYVHQYLTPSYEKEAECFFYENIDVLSELVNALDELDLDTWYFYTLHIGSTQANPPMLPDTLTHIFLKMEERTTQLYGIAIANGTVTITIKCGSYFDVYLYYGGDQLHSVKPEWDKQINLTSNWEIHSPYIMRS